MKVLLTGGSGFIAVHCLAELVKAGHEVVVTVRSDSKGQEVVKQYEDAGHKVSYVVVADMAVKGAFDEAVKSDPPFEAVLHTASPFHFRSQDLKADILDPAIQGTVGLLTSAKEHAPSVKTVVITSSMAAVEAMQSPPPVYTVADWNPVTMEQAGTDRVLAYFASKKFAEQAAWDFVKTEAPNFALTTINPPLVFGPVLHKMTSLDDVNTSNGGFAAIIQGKWKDEIPPTRPVQWVDVRDVAIAHVRAIEVPEAAGKRFLLFGGLYSNADIVSIVKNKFESLRAKLPEKAESDVPEGASRIDNSASKEILGLQYRTLEESVTDSVDSLLKYHHN